VLSVDILRVLIVHTKNLNRVRSVIREAKQVDSHYTASFPESVQHLYPIRIELCLRRIKLLSLTKFKMYS
jgi:hypothetical protein